MFIYINDFVVQRLVREDVEPKPMGLGSARNTLRPIKSKCHAPLLNGE